MNKKPSLLLVEDDYMDIENVERQLRKMNVTLPLFKARNGKDALQLLREDNYFKINPLPSVVMLDINMPRMNGIEFLKEIRKYPILKNLNVFIMTTSTEDFDKDAAKDLGISGYIEKPLTFETFGGLNGATVDTFSLFLDLLKLK